MSLRCAAMAASIGASMVKLSRAAIATGAHHAHRVFLEPLLRHADAAHDAACRSSRPPV
jgi:hypothetical protein